MDELAEKHPELDSTDRLIAYVAALVTLLEAKGIIDRAEFNAGLDAQYAYLANDPPATLQRQMRRLSMVI